MKRLSFIPYAVLAIVCGFFFGRLFFNDYKNNSLTTFSEGDKLYFIQIGVYNDLDSIKNNYSDYKNYLVLEEDDGFHVYVGISSSKEISNKIKGHYESLGNNIYIKEKYVNNYDFISILNEYDKITNITNNEKDLVEIEKIIISNYKEMVVEDES